MTKNIQFSSLVYAEKNINGKELIWLKRINQTTLNYIQTKPYCIRKSTTDLNRNSGCQESFKINQLFYDFLGITPSLSDGVKGWKWATRVRSTDWVGAFISALQNKGTQIEGIPEGILQKPDQLIYLPLCRYILFFI